jgi:sugar phosphate isomerase/epimerase
MAAHAARVRIVNIQLDDPSIDLADPNDVARAGSIGRVKQWMDRAALCGSPSLRTNVNINPPTQPIELDRVIASFAELARYGRRIGVVILVENHLGYTASIDRTIAVVSGVDDPWCRAIADWGNSPAADDAERIRDIGRLMPFTYLVSAKSVEFDTVGNHVTFDQAKLVQAAEASGYRGTYSIELYGPKPPPDPVAAARHVASTIAANLR